MNRPEVLARGGAAAGGGRIGVADRQSRHARRHRRRVGAALSARVSQRRPGDRGSGPGLEVRPQRHHPDRGGRAAKAWTTRRSGIASATNPRSRPSPARRPASCATHRAERRPASPGIVVDWAMRYGNPSLELADRGDGQARLRAHPAGAALSAIRRGDHRDGLRRGVRHAGASCASSRRCAWCRRITTTRSISMRWRPRSRRS